MTFLQQVSGVRGEKQTSVVWSKGEWLANRNGRGSVWKVRNLECCVYKVEIINCEIQLNKKSSRIQRGLREMEVNSEVVIQVKNRFTVWGTGKWKGAVEGEGTSELKMLGMRLCVPNRFWFVAEFGDDGYQSGGGHRPDIKFLDHLCTYFQDGDRQQ